MHIALRCSQNRLAYLTNKCFGDADLEYYIAEAGHILGVRTADGQTSAKHVLAEVSRRPPVSAVVAAAAARWCGAQARALPCGCLLVVGAQVFKRICSWKMGGMGAGLPDSPMHKISPGAQLGQGGAETFEL